MNSFEHWVKETIPGLVILGAVGSLLAIGVLKVSKMILRPYYQRLIKAYLIRELTFALKENYLLGRLSKIEHLSKIGLYVIFHLQRFILAVCFAIIALSVLIYSLSISSARLSILNIVAMIVLILSIYRIVRTTLHTALYYSALIAKLYPEDKSTSKDDKSLSK